jgi:hypothetical protein
MTRQSDPFDELRDADPVHGAPAPSESKARVWARIQEVPMDTSTPGERRQQSWVLGFATVAFAAFLVLAFVVRGQAAPDPIPPVGGGDGGGGTGICIAFSVDELAMRDFAFDGTVTAVDGDQVTFTVNESFVGELSGSVTLTAPDTSQTSLEGGVPLVQGERYLVSGDENIVWGCGFTQAYSDSAAAEWASAG